MTEFAPDYDSEPTEGALVASFEADLDRLNGSAKVSRTLAVIALVASLLAVFIVTIKPASADVPRNHLFTVAMTDIVLVTPSYKLETVSTIIPTKPIRTMTVTEWLEIRTQYTAEVVERRKFPLRDRTIRVVKFRWDKLGAETTRSYRRVGAGVSIKAKISRPKDDQTQTYRYAQNVQAVGFRGAISRQTHHSREKAR